MAKGRKSRSFAVLSSYKIRRLVNPIPNVEVKALNDKLSTESNPYLAVYEASLPVKAFKASRNQISSADTNAVLNTDGYGEYVVEKKGREGSPRWEPEPPESSSLVPETQFEESEVISASQIMEDASELKFAGKKRKREEDENLGVKKTKSEKDEEEDGVGQWVDIEQTPIFREIDGIKHAARRFHVAPQLQKYWAQRYRLFSLYDYGVLLDDEGWYSITPENIAKQIAERCRCNIVIDAYCGVGGNAIQFAFTCERVIAFDISPTRLELARHNATIYGVADRIEFICADFLEWVTHQAESITGTSSTEEGIEKIDTRWADVIFLSPPWGGIDYLSSPMKQSQVKGSEEYNYFELETLKGFLPISKLLKISKDLALFLPRNTKIQDISDLFGNEREGHVERLEVEEEWMGSKLKALTVYTGGLIPET